MQQSRAVEHRAFGASGVPLEKTQTLGHAPERAMCAIHSRHALSRNTEETFRSSATFRRRVAELGFDVSFRFQTIERGIDGADRYLTLNAIFDLLPDRDPIGSTTETQNRQDHHVLKFSEMVSTGHYIYNIE